MEGFESRRNSCRTCGGIILENLLALGRVEIYTSNNQHKDVAVDDRFLDAELDLKWCPSCLNIQLGTVVNPDVLYKNFSYRSEITQGLSEYFNRTAKYVVESIAKKINPKILDIGSNDGTFLKLVKSHNFNAELVGVEPSRVLAEKANRDGIFTKNAYFNTTCGKDLKLEFKEFDAIYCANTLANIDNLDEIFESVALLLSDEGMFVIDTQYGIDVLEKFLIDTVYHEHLTYFSVSSLKAVGEKYGLQISAVERTGQKGGGIQVTFSRRVLECVDPGIVDFERCAIEKNHGPVMTKRLNDMRERAAEFKSSCGESYFGFGASVGTTTLLRTLHLSNVEAIYDDNPLASSIPSAGRDIPILNGSVLQRSRSPIVLFAYRYISQIQRKHPNVQFFSAIDI